MSSFLGRVGRSIPTSRVLAGSSWRRRARGGSSFPLEEAAFSEEKEDLDHVGIEREALKGRKGRSPYCKERA